MKYFSNQDTDLAEFILDNSDLMDVQSIDVGIEVGSKNLKNLTPMDIAAEYGYLELVKKFIERYDEESAIQMQNPDPFFHHPVLRASHTTNIGTL